MNFLTVILNVFGGSKVKTVLIGTLLIGLTAYSIGVSYKLYKKTNEFNTIEKSYSDLKIEYNSLLSDYKLSEESNKQLKEINEENIAKANIAMEAILEQVDAERKIQNETVQRYREKISILQNAKNVDVSETTGVIDQGTSSSFIDRINGIIDEYNLEVEE